jgi:hypothetical protein
VAIKKQFRAPKGAPTVEQRERDPIVMQALEQIVGKTGIYPGPSTLIRRLQEVYGLRAPKTHVAVLCWIRRGNVAPDKAIQLAMLPEVHALGIKPRDLCRQLRVRPVNPNPATQE